MGTTTLVCGAAALLFGLSLPATQLINYFVYPLQLALIVPFIRAGELLLHSKRTSLSLAQMIALFQRNHLEGLHILWRFAVQGVVAWLVFAPLLFAAVYGIALPPIARLARSMARATSEVTP